MSYRWPHIDEEYYQLLRFIEDLNANASLESMQAEMLKMIVKSFKAECGNFCLHESEHGFARKDKTALLNLSWQFTDRYIKYYHDLDPFIKVMPEVGAFRNIDLMPLFSGASMNSTKTSSVLKKFVICWSCAFSIPRE
jgi:hypothetical protein